MFSEELLSSEFASSTNSRSMALNYCSLFSVQAVYDVNTPSAKLFAAAAVDTTANTATITAHGFKAGLVGQLTTSGGLPAGLSALTNYYIIVVDADTVKFATTLVNAQAGTAVDITTQGTGNHTFTPTALASATVKLQASNDNSNWDDIAGASAAITVDGHTMFNFDGAGFAWIRAVYTLASGQMSVTTNITGKEQLLRR